MLQTFQYQNSPITFNFDGEVMVNATQMAKPFGKKQPADFLRLDQTKEFADALSTRYGISHNEILKVLKGGSTQGTWMHQKLALKFAGWLNPDFELWVYERIEELLTTGKTELKPASKSETIMQAMKYLQADVESLKEQNKLLEGTIKQQAPKVEYCEKVLDAAGLIASTVVASDFGKSATWLHAELKKRHIMWKVNGVWVLTTKYSGKGYTQSKTFPYTDSIGQQRTSIQTYWTEKGRAFLHETLKEFLTEKAA